MCDLKDLGCGILDCRNRPSVNHERVMKACLGRDYIPLQESVQDVVIYTAPDYYNIIPQPERGEDKVGSRVSATFSGAFKYRIR